jgi:hypothetical protein
LGVRPFTAGRDRPGRYSFLFFSLQYECSFLFSDINNRMDLLAKFNTTLKNLNLIENETDWIFIDFSPLNDHDHQCRHFCPSEHFIFSVLCHFLRWLSISYYKSRSIFVFTVMIIHIPIVVNLMIDPFFALYV